MAGCYERLLETARVLKPGGELFSPADVRRIIDQAPHMLLEHDEGMFTSVFVLSKRENRG